jgi:hypothetical protein
MEAIPKGTPKRSVFFCGYIRRILPEAFIGKISAKNGQRYIWFLGFMRSEDFEIIF